MDEKKKQEVKKIRTKLNLISIQKDVLDEKGMDALLGGNGPESCTCDSSGDSIRPSSGDTGD